MEQRYLHMSGSPQQQEQSDEGACIGQQSWQCLWNLGGLTGWHRHDLHARTGRAPETPDLLCSRWNAGVCFMVSEDLIQFLKVCNHKYFNLIPQADR